MGETIRRWGREGIAFCQGVGTSGLFLFSVIFRRPKWRKSLPLLAEQIVFVGIFSLLIVLVSGLFIGMVVSLQGYNTLDKFGATSELGQVIALSVMRELGPVITALLFAGRAGSALCAEIGLMKTTEQLSSMEMMGVDPLWRVIWPRFWAGCISMPILSLLFCAIAVWGGYWVGVVWLGVDSGLFWNNMQARVHFSEDILSGIVKSLVFGVAVTWIAVYQGYASVPTAQGIGAATTRTVVYGSLAVLGLDFILTTMMMRIWT